jgi:predicted CopG family antitoxin
MTRKLTITVEDEVYESLRSVVGRRRISRFLNDLARPHVTGRDLAEAYRHGLRLKSANARRPSGWTIWAETWPMIQAPDRRPQRGEVWWVSFDPAVGGEIRKRGPP